MSPEKLQLLKAKYTSEARYRRELEIEYEALEGELLLPEFNRERNLCEPFDVSDRERWTLYMGLDPHPRTAHAMVWEAFNKHGDRVVAGEMWPEFGTTFGPTDGIRWHTREYGEWIQFFESDSEEKPEPFRWARGKRLFVRQRFMDTFGSAANSDEGEDYFETYRRIGQELTKKCINNASMAVNLNFTPALKGHDNLAKAYDSVARTLMPQQDEKGSNIGPPRMRIFNNLYETIDECENVRFPRGRPMPGDDFTLDGVAARPADEKVISYQKHCLDCIFYIETARPRFIMPMRGPIPQDYHNVVR